MNKKDLIIFLVLAYLMYKVHCLTKEQFSYQEPTQAIKNLGKLAKQLTKGGLTIPGNVTITGELSVNKAINAEGGAAQLSSATINNKKVGALYLDNGGGKDGRWQTIRAVPGYSSRIFVENLYSSGKVQAAKGITANRGVDIGYGYGLSFSNNGRTQGQILPIKNGGIQLTNNTEIDGNLTVSTDIKAGRKLQAPNLNITDTTKLYNLTVTEDINANSDIHSKGNIYAKWSVNTPNLYSDDNFIKNGDMINLNQNNKGVYLNTTTRNISADKPGNYARWAYLSNTKDGGEKFKIEKE